MRKLIEENRLEKLGVGVETGGRWYAKFQSGFVKTTGSPSHGRRALSKASNADAL